MTLYTSLKKIAKKCIIIPEIGDYVRTKDGLIAKYISYDKKYECHRFDGNIQWYYEYYRDDIDNEDWEEFLKEKVVNSSPNIIDLMKVGDIVNNRIVEQKYIDLTGRTALIINILNNRFMKLYEKDIKSIVTQEKIKSMEYIIGE